MFLYFPECVQNQATSYISVCTSYNFFWIERTLRYIFNVLSSKIFLNGQCSFWYIFQFLSTVWTTYNRPSLECTTNSPKNEFLCLLYYVLKLSTPASKICTELWTSMIHSSSSKLFLFLHIYILTFIKIGSFRRQGIYKPYRPLWCVTEILWFHSSSHPCVSPFMTDKMDGLVCHHLAA